MNIVTPVKNHFYSGFEEIRIRYLVIILMDPLENSTFK